MTEELKDEVEAINSIYGEGCLVQSADDADVYILTPPEQEVSLRIEFPTDYPCEPPAVVSTNSTGTHGRRGDAARELSLFRQAVGTVYQPGMVCLFDAIEELTRLLKESVAPEQDEQHEAVIERLEEKPQADNFDSEPLSIREPPWIISDPIVEMKSTFIARCATVSSTSEAEAFVQHLVTTDKKVRIATHNITAWRIRGPNNTSFQDCDDDGETVAGGRLLHLMQLMDLWDVMVIVSRWYGGHKLGPRRFALINQVARDAFVKAGVVEEISANKKKSSKS